MSLSQRHFEEACDNLQTRFQLLDETSKWARLNILQSYGIKYLQIVKQIDIAQPEPRNDTFAEEQGKELEVEDGDDENLLHSSHEDERIAVIYDIIHSSSYQVPVLYVTFKQPPGQSARGGSIGLPPPDKVYDLLVPASHKAQMEAVGVMGALSMADHPISGTPAYFVHPCRTAEAMSDLTGGKNVSPEEYLLMWLGLVGQSVGLEVPIELAAMMNESV